MSRRRRNYAAMLPENLFQAIEELEDHEGDAYDRCMQRGSGNPEADLDHCFALLKERGQIQDPPMED